jgi:hypothetical protein
MVCPAETSVMAGDIKEPRKPWNMSTAPKEKVPFIVIHTPTTSTA